MVSSGSVVLDDFLGGYSSGLTMTYGEAGTGKTTLALLLSLAHVKEGKKVLFLDTEGSFSVQRFEQLAGCDVSPFLDKLFLMKVKNFSEQHKLVKTLPGLVEQGKFSLVVIDTMTISYRRFVKKKPQVAKAMLKMQLRTLKDLGVPVFVTNQVYTSFEKGITCVADYVFSSYVGKSFQLQLEPRLVSYQDKQLAFEIRQEGLVF